MLGIAQRQFIEKCGKNPWQNFVHLSKGWVWPILDKMLAAQCVDYVDIALAQKLLQAEPQAADQACAALICHLSLAARQGHLCVTIERGKMVPVLQELWASAEALSLSAEKIAALPWLELEALIKTGAEMIDSRLVHDVELDIKPFADAQHFDLPFDLPMVPIYRQNHRYYLQRYWIVESRFVTQLKRLLFGVSPSPVLDMAQVKSRVNDLLDQQVLLPEQALAVINGCQHAFSMITGGPGTGKTHTAGVLLRTLWESMSVAERAHCRFVLAAPTGKAASQLEGSIRRAMLGVADFPPLTAQTLHMLLGIHRNGSVQTAATLAADVVIVDESSMIDAHLMGQLMFALKPGARLVLLGDRHQLPPVESGALFADLVRHLVMQAEAPSHVVELKTCLRAELRSILDLAEAVKDGDVSATWSLLEAADAGIRYQPLTDGASSKEQQRHLLNYALEHFPLVDYCPRDPLEVLRQFSCFRILTPLRQGALGAVTLNALFYQAALQRSKGAECFLVPIMITANHHRLGVFNGEMGLLLKYPRESKRDVAFFAARDAAQGVRELAALLLPKFEYAYCISVHKSQGSEFEHVLLLLPEGSERFGREALYTAVTRAKRLIEVWGGEETLRQMMQRQALRHSGVGERF